MVGRRRPRGSRDGGSTHILEATLFSCILVGSVAFVVTHDPGPPPATFSEDEHLEQLARELLLIANDLPSKGGPCDGGTVLDSLVIPAASRDPTPFIARKNARAGAYTLANLDLDNLHGEYSLVREFEGLANAGYTFHYSPDLSWSKILTPTDAVSGEAMAADVAAFHHGVLAKPRGEAIRTRVVLSDHKELVGTSLTAVFEPNGDRTHVQNVSWIDMTTGAQKLTRNITSLELADGAYRQAQKLAVRVEPPPAGNPIPNGNTVDVQLPPKWDEVVPKADGWNHSTTGSKESGWTVTFVANGSKATAQTLRISAKPPTGLTRPYDLITAQLSNGSLGRSTFVVTYPVPADQSLPRRVYATTPYPMRLGSTALLGAVFVNGGPPTKVREVNIEVEGGYDLFRHDGRGAALFALGGPPIPLNETAHNGSWSTSADGRRIVWKGNLEVEAGEAVDWLVGVNITSDPTQATAVEGPLSKGVVTRLTFPNGYNVTSAGWGATTGVNALEAVADSLDTSGSDGYAWAAIPPQGAPVEHVVTAQTIGAAAVLSTVGTYRAEADTSDLASVRNALANGSMRAHARAVPVGSLSSIELDVESLVTTLAANGAVGLGIDVDLYTPLSLGCAPTRSWSRDASSLPLAGITSAIVFDELGLGTPSVYAAAEDRHVYRVTSLGVTAWAREHGSIPTSLDAATLASGAPALFVGEVDGTITRRDPMLAGELVWRETLAPMDLGGSTKVLGIHANATNGKVLIHTPHVIELRDIATGGMLARRETGSLLVEYVQVAWAPGGAVHALDTHALRRLNESLSLQDVYFMDDAVGFGATPAGVFLTRGANSTILDGETLNELATRTHSAPAVLVAAGDATGDGLADLAVALDTFHVEVYDGVTGALAFTRSPIVPDWVSVGAEVPTFSPPDIWRQGDDFGVEGERPYPALGDCRNSGLSPGADEYAVCIDPNDNDLKPMPIDLDLADGGVVLTYRVASLAGMAIWRHDLPQQLGAQFGVGELPTTVTTGRWTLGAPVVLVGTNDGTLAPYDARTARALWSVEPTRLVGKFSFNMRVPEGGFFGTDLLLARVRWEDPALGPREARLWEWIDVVGPDGKPVTEPEYLLRLRMRSAEYPVDP